MFFALLAVVGTILAIGFQNIAAATPEQVNFNPVTIRNGAKIHVNGDKTLTAIDNGNKLFADNTNGTAVKGNQIESELNSFATNNYGDDALFKANAASNPKSLSEAELNVFRQYLPAVDNDYWLTDIGSRGSISWQGYANSDNSLNNNSLQVTGKIDDIEYDETQVTKGSFAFNKDTSLESYTASIGGQWDLSSTQTANFRVYYTNSYWFGNGTTVYNNPYCRDSGVDSEGKIYRSSVIQNLHSGSGAKVFGYVSSGNKIVQVQPNQKLTAGTILVFGFMRVYNEIKDPTGFLIPPSYFWTGSWGSVSYIGFIKTTFDVVVSGKYAETQPLYGVLKYYPNETDITAIPIKSAEKSVRPSFAMDDKVSFTRPATSSSILSLSYSFGDVPTTSASNNEDKKLVIKSAETTITNSLSDSNLSTEKSANNHAVTKYTNGVIQVPYGAKTLTIDASAFSTSNANYISALANVNGTQKYAVLGQTGENLEIDLASIVNNSQVGSKAAVSFYAEQANPANTSDVISETPVTVEIEVVEGPEQTIKYANGGGTGTLPENAKVKAGKSFALADGSGLSKDGNLFSCWQLTYTPYGEADVVTRLVRSNESIVVPDTTNGTITATAMYSGVTPMKSTDSKSSVVTVTWDSNAPDGTTATFTDSTGTYNDDKSIRYDKIKIAGTGVAVPGAPSLSVTTKIFDGWYDAKDGGNKVAVSVNPSVNTTYYAHWLDGYRVTYDATGGTGATQTGKWSDGTNKDVEELVLPGASTKGPSKGTPVADDSLYMFYGWFPQPNGGGTELTTGTPFDTLGGSKTVYAYYGPMNTFLAPATSAVTANPRNISGDKYSIAQVKAAADLIKSGTNPNENVYNSTNDSYHLYSLLKGDNGEYLSPELTNSWAEFRIIGVGDHDGDGSGLTFQMVHGMPSSTGWAYDSNQNSGSSLNWAKSTLRPLLQSGGSIYNQFDTQLTSRIMFVAKKYNTTAGSKPTSSTISTTTDAFTILSYTEYQKSVNTNYWTTGQVGSTYAFWDQYSIVNDSSLTLDPLKKLCRSRSNVANSGWYSGYVWQRSVSPYISYRVLSLTVFSGGSFDSREGDYSHYEYGVALSFSL